MTLISKLLKEKAEIESLENPTEEQKRTLMLIKDRLELNGFEEKEETINARELLEKDFPPIQWLVEKMIPEESIGVIVAPRGSYKSWLALYLSVCLSKGLTLFNRIEVKKSNVLYIDMESSQRIVHERLKMIQEGLETKVTENLEFMCFTKRRIDNMEDLDSLVRLIKKNKTKVVVIDTFKRSHNMKENLADDMSDLFTNYIRKLQLDTKVTIILIHHTRKKPLGSSVTDKMDMARGSSEIANYVDWFLMVDRKPRSRFIKISHEKSRFSAELETIGLNINFQDNKVSFEYIPEVEWNISEAPYVVKIINEWIAEKNISSFKTKEVKEFLKNRGENFQNTTINRALNTMEEIGKIRKIKRGNYEVVISLNSIK